jgi:metal-responsive CopG/Arc/MetJ family transcriptional regulator
MMTTTKKILFEKKTKVIRPKMKTSINLISMKVQTWLSMNMKNERKLAKNTVRIIEVILIQLKKTPIMKLKSDLTTIITASWRILTSTIRILEISIITMPDLKTTVLDLVLPFLINKITIIV